MRARVLILTLALGCVFSAGCRNRQYRDPPRPQGNMTIPPAGIPEGVPPAPIPRASPAPPAGGGAELLLPQSPPNKTRSEYPRIVGPDSRGAILGEPDAADTPKAADARKPGADDQSGIVDFAEVKDGIATGQRPTIDGLDWLKSQRYKSVIYVRTAKEDDTTDRRQVELRDMKYVGQVISPQTLTKDWMEQFNRIVGESASTPIFVYGDPATVGPVWYLHLRMVEFLTHDEARVRAGRFGLKDETSELFQAALKVMPK